MATVDSSNAVIPRTIQWKDVTLPEEWILEGAAQPQSPKRYEPNTNLRNVTQFSDGRVKLSFDRKSTSSRYSDEGFTSLTIDLGRASQLPSVIYASYPHDQQIQTRFQPRFSTSEIPSSTLKNVKQLYQNLSMIAKTKIQKKTKHLQPLLLQLPLPLPKTLM